MPTVFLIHVVKFMNLYIFSFIFQNIGVDSLISYFSIGCLKTDYDSPMIPQMALPYGVVKIALAIGPYLPFAKSPLVRSIFAPVYNCFISRTVSWNQFLRDQAIYILAARRNSANLYKIAPRENELAIIQNEIK